MSKVKSEKDTSGVKEAVKHRKQQIKRVMPTRSKVLSIRFAPAVVKIWEHEAERLDVTMTDLVEHTMNAMVTKNHDEKKVMFTCGKCKNDAVSARAALLQALLLEAGFGLKLIERVHTQTNGAVVLTKGDVYPMLRELEDDGFVTSEVDGRTDGRPRRVYKITPKGKKEALTVGK